MVFRTECLYDGKIIGIESIYTVVDGKQINIEGKVEHLRRLGREGKLYCPCGCGTNLIVVAGEKNLRAQHFRVKAGAEGNVECQAKDERLKGTLSKIILKCWLDSICNSLSDTRVSLKELLDIDSKYEFSVLNRNKQIGICYWLNDANITDEKISEIGKYEELYKAIYIADIGNRLGNEQYPEFIMKIQSTQGYALFMEIGASPNINPLQAGKFIVCLNVKSFKGTWEEIKVAEGKLENYSVNEEGQLTYRNEPVSILVRKAKEEYQALQEHEREEYLRREKERKEREMEQKLLLVKTEDEILPAQILKAKLEDISSSRGFSSIIQQQVLQNSNIVTDLFGKRWLQCKFCKKISIEDDFSSYGGEDGPAVGVCYNCKNYAVEELLKKAKSIKVKAPMCPLCGGVLKEKTGPYGSFLGCSKYPSCRFTARR